MFVAWVLFPLVLLAVCLGCGLAVEWVAGRRLPGALLLPVGLALVIVATTLVSARADTAFLTTPVVIVLALAGYALSWRRLLTLRPEPWAVAVGLGVFAICAAPVVLSGNASFLGYYVDSDPAFHFELGTWVAAHGRDVSQVPKVSIAAVPNLLHEYIDTAYPTGADVALGAIRPLVGQNYAWIYQPYLALLIAFGALALQELLRTVVSSRALRAACAFIAAQGGLVYAFYLEGSIKEFAATLVITLTCVLVIEALRRPLRVRALAPLAIVGVAGLDVYSVTIIPWLGIPVAVLAVLTVWRGRDAVRGAITARREPRAPRRRPSWRAAAWPAAAGVVLVLAAPIISGASTFTAVASSVLGQQNILGNLAAPLSGWQLLGIWPSGDFRYPVVTQTRVAFVLMGVALAGAALGSVWMVRRRAFAPLLLLVSDGIAAIYLLTRASPYAASKVLMILSIAVLLAAMLGAAALHETGRRIEGWLLAAVIGAGVLWTNFLAYHDSSVAPRARFAELASINQRFNGRGPAFYDLWDTFGVYFLRDLGVAAPDTFAGPAPELPGIPSHNFGQPSSVWDPNQIEPGYLQAFHLLVLGRSPVLSRPPANFRLAYQGRYYDVWQRTSTPLVLRHIPLSFGGFFTSKPPSCSTITSTAALAARDHGRLAYVARPSLPTLIPTKAAHPPFWPPSAANGYGPADVLSLGQRAGKLTGTIHVPAPGRYQVWLEGSLSRRVKVWVGNRFAGSVAHQIGTSGQVLQVGTVDLAAGDQPVEIQRPAAGLAPGNVLGGDALGPLVLVRSSAPPAVRQVAPSQARSICGLPLEWLEIVS